MNPAIVIPTYWTDGPTRATTAPGTAPVSYDYATPLSKPLPELELCLSSLDQVRGVLRVIVLVVAPHGVEASARARVEAICRTHPDLRTLVVGSAEAAVVRRAVARYLADVDGDPLSLRGYGAIRNVGLAVAAVLGHDVVVFMDDDEVALDDRYLIDATYGLGAETRQGLPIRAKTGYYVTAEGSPYARGSSRWADQLWTKAPEFNQVMRRALEASTRITRSKVMCGGCCALHADAFGRVPFDPYVTRGEDLDYLLSLRAVGLDVWFDNAWHVRMQPPDEAAPEPQRFLQDVYRWLYEYRKVEAMNARQDLHTISTESLMPYPAPWVTRDVRGRVWGTVARRAVSDDDRRAYLRIARQGTRAADAYAVAACRSYLSFASVWPTAFGTLWDDRRLAAKVLGTAGRASARRGETRPAAR